MSQKGTMTRFDAFVTGFGSVIDLFGVSLTLETHRRRGDLASDAIALRGDWLAVGNDLRRVADREKERGEETGTPR